MESDSNLSVQDVGAVIVNWNAGAYLENCLRSFLLEGVLVRNIVVVDHGSSDDSVGIVRQHFPEVRVIIDTRNPGYSTAINHGTRHLSTPVFVVSNPDIVVQEGALSEILRSFQSDGTVALAGCKLVDQYGNDATRFSRTSVTRAVLLLIVPSNFRGYWRAHEQRVHNWKQPFEVSYVEGAFMVIRRAVFDAVGGFDEDFSFFFEDADFPLRLRKSGWKVVHIPGASVTHLGNASFSKVPVRRTVEFYKNILLLYEKHSYRRFLWLRRILFLIVKTKLSLFSILRLGSLRLVAQKIEINRELLQVFHQYRVERNSRAKEELPIHDGQNEDRGPLVSVIIPTYNRVDCLLQLLDVLKRQTYQNFEVLVVDQSDMVDEAKERSYRSFGSKLKVLHSHTRGRSLAKNLGIGKARGDLLLFCDDDVIPGPDLIEVHVQAHKSAEIGGVSCRTVQRGLPEVRSRRILQITGYGEMIAGYQADVTCFAKTLVGSNMSVSREVQRRVGWFDTNFTGTSLFEEQDFSARLRRLGYYILFTNKTTVQHVPQPNGNDDLKRSQPALYYHWFHHNEIVYFLKNYSRFNLVCVIPFCLLRSIKQSILRRLSLGDAVYMFSGVFEGFKTYYTALS